MLRIFLFFIALIFSVTGLSYIIMYLNLFTMGYSLKEYLCYIGSKIECLVFILGYILLYISILSKERGGK